MTVLSFYNEVADDQVIWRYMDFPKFFSLIENRSLFFCPAYYLKKKEPFEYEVPVLNAQKSRETISKRLLKSGRDPEAVEKYVDEVLSGVDDIFHWGVSCWSSNPIESYALWRTFVTAAEGVAIKSCPARLQWAVKPSHKEFMKVGNVQYLDHEKDQLEKELFTQEDRLFHKAKFYEHEREFRIITHPFFDPKQVTFPDSLEDPKFKESLTVPVVLEELIEEVRVSPYAPKWFYELVRDYVKRARLPAEVVQSSIRIGS